ncbi:SDR family oxidoreductase [Dehalobacter sp. DCM]|uniref:SDR family NAD(P)-dependent oxidoreductase n=1 Tax=Dehalobacter sp. DCM TaxID=2907827 RepID=UPI003081FA6D|nr:SDR family oxidoreductase [Dehalobacter sp. DCM]
MISDRFKGKTAIITGGASGLGKAVATGFAGDGANVVITDINTEAGLAVVAELKSSGAEAAFVSANVGKSEDCQHIIQFALDTYGSADILVNNAGVSIYGSIADYALEDWQKTLDINLTGPFMLMKAVIPHMQKAGGGSIINIASLAGLRCIPKGVSYCASKAALIHLTKQVALDYGEYHIRCNVICPGLFLTDMVAEGFDQTAKELGTDLETFMTTAFQDLPLRHPAYPEQLYGTCRYLASDDSAYMTGNEILLDGGTHVLDPFSVCVAKAAVVLEK